MNGEEEEEEEGRRSVAILAQATGRGGGTVVASSVAPVDGQGQARRGAIGAAAAREDAEGERKSLAQEAKVQERTSQDPTEDPGRSLHTRQPPLGPELLR